MQTHNDYFGSLSAELCTEVNKKIIIRNNSQRYDSSIVNLRHQRRRADVRWHRVRTESSRRQCVATQSAIVSAIAH